MIRLFQQVKLLFSRRRVARKIGIAFDRSLTFILPRQILINSQSQPLYLPNEHGVKVAFIDIFLDDCYGINTISKNTKHVRSIIDIGANAGLFGVAARIVFPTATIHAYEPSYILEQYLSNQAKIANFTYFMEAVGAENGSVRLHVIQDSVLTKSVIDPSGTIPQISFRDAIQRIGGNVDLLKMDCEGAEWNIFEDVASWKYVNNLSMEYHLFQGQNHQDAASVVQRLGFIIKKQVRLDGCGLLIAKRKDDNDI